MQIYLVGGAVRDQLLGLPVKERDYVVTGTTPAQLTALGFLQLNDKFPVFKHPVTGDEYAIARRETKIATGYKGFVIETSSDVTLEEDLARRDLTINAIAQDKTGRIIDPFGGCVDLQARRLRHITPAFVDDPVRLLRIARFAAQFWHLGFRITHTTYKLLREMVQPSEMLSLVPQHLRKVMLQALITKSPWQFFTILQRIEALQYLIPELAIAIGQISPHSVDVPALLPVIALQRAVALSANPTVRFTALMTSTLDNTNSVIMLCQNLHLEKSYIDLLTLAIIWTVQRVAIATAQELLELLETNRFLHRSEKLKNLTEVWRAIDPVTGIIATNRVTAALHAVKTVTVQTLKDTSLNGKNLGIALRQKRLSVIEQLDQKNI